MTDGKTMPVTAAISAMQAVASAFPEGYAEAKRRERNRSMKITPEQGLYIRCGLRLKGVTMKAIADEVGCARQTVYTVLSGRGHSKRIEAAVARRLAYGTWNDMVRELRKGAG